MVPGGYRFIQNMLYRTHFSNRPEKGPYRASRYIHKLVKNLLCRYMMYVPLNVTQRCTVTLDANEGGERGRGKNYKEKDQS